MNIIWCSEKLYMFTSHMDPFMDRGYGLHGSEDSFLHLMLNTRLNLLRSEKLFWHQNCFRQGSRWKKAKRVLLGINLTLCLNNLVFASLNPTPNSNARRTYAWALSEFLRRHLLNSLPNKLKKSHNLFLSNSKIPSIVSKSLTLGGSIIRLKNLSTWCQRCTI